MSINSDSWWEFSTILSHWMVENLCVSCKASCADAVNLFNLGATMGNPPLVIIEIAQNIFTCA